MSYQKPKVSQHEDVHSAMPNGNISFNSDNYGRFLRERIIGKKNTLPERVDEFKRKKLSDHINVSYYYDCYFESLISSKN